MVVLFLLNGIVALIISILFLGGFLRHYNRDYINHVTNQFSLIFFSYLTLAVIYFAWLFDFFSFSPGDYTLIYSIAIFFQTVILFRVTYSFTKDKRLFLFLFSYLVLFLLFNSFTMPFVVATSLIISFLLIMVISFNFINTSAVCKRVGYIGILYSSVSLIFSFMIFFNVGGLIYSGLFSNFLFLLFVFYFLRDVRDYPLNLVEGILVKEEPYITLFIKYFVYIIVLTNLVLISTIGVHEFGHVLVSRYYGCESRSIIFEEGTYAYSEIVCSDLSGKTPIALSGPLLPMAIAIIVFLIGGRFIRPISFLVAGFDILASYRDLLEIELGRSLIFAISIWGAILLFIGIVLLARSRIQEYHPHLV